MVVLRGRTHSLYQLLDSLNPNPKEFKILFGILNEKDENTCGIFVKGGTPSESERSLSTGEYLVRKSFVTFNVNGSPLGDYGTVNGLAFCEDFISKLERLNNKLFYPLEGGNNLYVLKVDILGDVNDLGLNHFQTPVFSFNIAIHYKEVI